MMNSTKVVAAPAAMKSEYGTQEYWDKRYLGELEDEDGGPENGFDWLIEYEDMQPWVEKWSSDSGLIVDLGCGNSRLVEGLAANVHRHILGIDYSVPGLEQVVARLGRPPLDLAAMDGLFLALRSDTVDVLIDKGFLDSIMNLNDQYHWWLKCGKVKKLQVVQEEESAASIEKARQALCEIKRVLCPGGHFLLTSLSSRGRNALLLDSGFTICDSDEDSKGNHRVTGLKPMATHA